MGSDFWLVFYWWVVLFLFGVAAFPLTRLLFHRWWDHGYGLSKAVGIAVVTYLVWVGASVRLIPFTQASVLAYIGLLFAAGILGTYFVIVRRGIGASVSTDTARRIRERIPLLIIAGEEMLFYLSLLFWSWIKGHESSIRSLEKFMDFGFTQTILNSSWFPAPDMWYAGHTINYYIFGHTMMAVVTKLADIDLAFTFNIMLATLFALCFTMSFAIGTQCMATALRRMRRKRIPRHTIIFASLVSGIVTAFLTSLGGNLQTIYAFTRGYIGEENVRPFWELTWDTWTDMIAGIPNYWYANATRFIPYTIHEFPSYSFVVSDVHGHVLGIPLALLAIAFFYTVFVIYPPRDTVVGSKYPVLRYGIPVVAGLLVSMLFMTNALDGPIYAGLFLILSTVSAYRYIGRASSFFRRAGAISLVMLGSFVVFSLPFLTTFDSFVSGIGVNCPVPPFTDKTIGLFIFEGVEKCQRSPLWMMLILWGFFVFNGMWFLLSRFAVRKKRSNAGNTEFTVFFVIVFVFSMGLLEFPEIFYFKDIYPAHFRSNTMFKLGYQVFIMLSILSSYVIVSYAITAKRNIWKVVYYTLVIPQIVLVMLYPILAVRTYFNSLRNYEGLYGFSWFSREYPLDTQIVSWFVKQREADMLVSYGDTPVIVEAEGESYTDHARISARTGIPAVIGWPVHEWLWRGTYDVVGPRVDDTARIYSSENSEEIRRILDVYSVSYIVVGELERRKYPAIPEHLYASFAEIVFEYGDARIYRVNRIP